MRTTLQRRTMLRHGIVVETRSPTVIHVVQDGDVIAADPDGARALAAALLAHATAIDPPPVTAEAVSCGCCGDAGRVCYDDGEGGIVWAKCPHHDGGTERCPDGCSAPEGGE